MSIRAQSEGYLFAGLAALVIDNLSELGSYFERAPGSVPTFLGRRQREIAGTLEIDGKQLIWIPERRYVRHGFGALRIPNQLVRNAECVRLGGLTKGMELTLVGRDGKRIRMTVSNSDSLPAALRRAGIELA